MTIENAAIKRHSRTARSRLTGEKLVNATEMLDQHVNVEKIKGIDVEPKLLRDLVEPRSELQSRENFHILCDARRAQ